MCIMETPLICNNRPVVSSELFRPLYMATKRIISSWNNWHVRKKMIIRPVHVAVSVLRCRANNVPFSRHGSICYPMKRPVQAARLPWYDFVRLPFIIVAQRRRDGTHSEAMVNMANIIKARVFMERRMPCRYNPQRTRPYYRFVDEQWVPFSNDNFARLQDRLPTSDGPCLPNNVRVLHVDDVHSRADKVMHYNQFVNWLESGFSMAEILRKQLLSWACRWGCRHNTGTRTEFVGGNSQWS